MVRDVNCSPTNLLRQKRVSLLLILGLSDAFNCYKYSNVQHGSHTHLLKQNRKTLNNKQPVEEKAHTNYGGADGYKTLKPNAKNEQPPLEGIIIEIT